MRSISTTCSKTRIRMRGFTLMELMFTLALAAVLVGVGVPSFRSIMANNRLTTQTNEFIGAVNFARSEAITRNAEITFCRAAAETSDECATDDEPWAAWIVIDEDGDLLRNGVINQASGTMQVTSDLTDQSLAFGSDGLGRTGGGLLVDSVITVCTSFNISQNIRRVAVGAGSRVSTTKDEGDCE